jgi:hypothetical protein
VGPEWSRAPNAILRIFRQRPARAANDTSPLILRLPHKVINGTYTSSPATTSDSGCVRFVKAANNLLLRSLALYQQLCDERAADATAKPMVDAGAIVRGVNLPQGSEANSKSNRRCSGRCRARYALL